MTIFVDSASLRDIDDALKRGFPGGITTNPSIIAKEEKGDFHRHIRRIIELARSHGREIPISVEVFTLDPAEMVAQADALAAEFHDYAELYIKVPIGWDELAVIRELKCRGMKVNCTCCMSLTQAVLAAHAGADFVSLFWGRIRDGGEDPAAVVRSVKTLFRERGMAARIIVGSMRSPEDVTQALLAGADIVTVPPTLFAGLVSHPKTTEVVRQFISDFQEWIR